MKSGDFGPRSDRLVGSEVRSGDLQSLFPGTSQNGVLEEPKPLHFVKKKKKTLHFRVLRKESLEIP